MITTIIFIIIIIVVVFIFRWLLLVVVVVHITPHAYITHKNYLFVQKQHPRWWWWWWWESLKKKNEFFFVSLSVFFKINNLNTFDCYRNRMTIFSWFLIDILFFRVNIYPLIIIIIIIIRITRRKKFWNLFIYRY